MIGSSLNPLSAVIYRDSSSKSKGIYFAWSVSRSSLLHTTDFETVYGLKNLKSDVSGAATSAPKSLLGTGRTLESPTNEQQSSRGAGTSPAHSDKLDLALKGKTMMSYFTRKYKIYLQDKAVSKHVQVSNVICFSDHW